MSGKFKCLLGKEEVSSLWMEDGELYCICVNKNFTKEEALKIALKELENWNSKNLDNQNIKIEITNNLSCLFRDIETERYFYDTNTLDNGYMKTEPMWIHWATQL